MLIGQTVFCTGDMKTFYSPWFPRGGAGATFAVEVIAITASTSITVRVETKNSESDDQVAAGSVITLGSTGSTAVSTETVKSWFDGSKETGDAQGCLELVRFRYEVSLTAGSLGLVTFRMLNPSWVSD